jgi:predicted nucleotidyltransferase
MTPFAVTIALGGSWARGTATPQSDIDLYIICPDHKAKKALLSVILRTNNRAKVTRLLLDTKSVYAFRIW